MALHTPFIATLLTLSILIYKIHANQAPTSKFEDDLLEFPQNFAYLAAEFYLFCAKGQGLDAVAPDLVQGGPAPIGGQLANLDSLTRDISLEFGYIGIGHLRAIKSKVKSNFPRPLLNLSKELFAEIMDQAFGQPLNPPFDPYANPTNFLLGSYVASLVAPTVYVAITPELQSATSKRLVAGLLGVAYGLDTTIRAYLYERRHLPVPPYKMNVAEFTNRISIQGNKLGKEGTKSKGIEVPPSEGSEGKVSVNVIDDDQSSLSYSRTPQGALRIAYGSGDEHVPGGFFPDGANGRIARSYLHNAP